MASWESECQFIFSLIQAPTGPYSLSLTCTLDLQFRSSEWPESSSDVTVISDAWRCGVILLCWQRAAGSPYENMTACSSTARLIIFHSLFPFIWSDALKSASTATITLHASSWRCLCCSWSIISSFSFPLLLFCLLSSSPLSLIRWLSSHLYQR